MIKKSGKWVGKRKKAKLFLTFVGAIAMTIGSLFIETTFGSLLLPAGILIEVFNVYAISIVTEEARKEIDQNRSEIMEMLEEIRGLDKNIENNSEYIKQVLADMRDYSKEIEESKDEIKRIQSEISGYQRDLDKTQRDIERASDKAVDAKKEAEDIRREIIRAGRRF